MKFDFSKMTPEWADKITADLNTDRSRKMKQIFAVATGKAYRRRDPQTE